MLKFTIMNKRFNVRVYGLLIDQGTVLVCDENIKGQRITKFPGGGLEFGEGTKECLVREFWEEMRLDVEVAEHFYTTDFYVASAFDPSSQVISIYYKVKPKGGKRPDLPDPATVKSDLPRFRWIKLSELRDTDVSLVIDKKVVDMLLHQKALHTS